MVLEYFFLDFFTTFVLYMATHTLCDPLEYTRSQLVVQVITLRLLIGCFLNMLGYGTLFGIFVKDGSNKNDGEFVCLCLTLMYFIIFSTCMRFMFYRTFSKINNANIHKYWNRFRFISMVYRFLEMLYNTLLLCYCLYLSDWKMSLFMIGVKCVYCIEMLTCLIVLAVLIQNKFGGFEFNKSVIKYNCKRQRLRTAFMNTTTHLTDIYSATTETSFSDVDETKTASVTEIQVNIEPKVRRQLPKIECVKSLETIVCKDATSSRAREVMHLEKTAPTSPVILFQSSKSNAMGSNLCWISQSQKRLPESSTLIKSDFIKNFWIDLIMDKRIDNRINKAIDQYKGFDIFLNCNGFAVNCNVDKRLHTSIMTGNAISLETFINRKTKMSDFETLLLTLNHVKRKTLSTQFWTDIFFPVVQKKSSIVCQFLLTAISEVDTYVWQQSHVYLMDGLSRAMNNQDQFTGKTIAWFITRKFFLSLSSNFLDNIIDIWPAFQCNCLDKKQVIFCGQTVAIIVEVDKFCPAYPDRFWEIDVKYILKDELNHGECSSVQEHLQSLNSTITCDFPKKVSISGIDSKHLFDKHTNLSLICKSPFKSTGFRTNNHIIIKQPCIQLYCKKKGFIPIGENHFPRTVVGLQTDILNGSPHFLSNLKVGDQIGSDSKMGTLGGFVKVRGDTAFLTCLHVFLNADELASDNLSLDDEQTVWVKCYRENASIVCGKIREMAFEVDNENEISIDAALIELKEGITIDALDYVSSKDINVPFSSIGMHSMYLNDSCVDYKDLRISDNSILQTVTVGAVSGYSQINMTNIDDLQQIHADSIDLETIDETYSKVVIENITDNVKYAIQSLQSVPIPVKLHELDADTIGKHCRDNISSGIRSTCIDVIKHMCETSPILHDKDIEAAIFSKTQRSFSAIIGDVHMQWIFLKRTHLNMSTRRTSRRVYNQIYIPKIPFKQGDSGTCIYVKKSGQGRTGCIGMAIATHPLEGCIATPIKAILKHFKLRIK